MKYRLLAPHVLPDGVILEEGTEVGDDTSWPWRYPYNNEPMPPSNMMEGLDDEGKKAIEELHNKLYGQGPYWENSQPEEVRKAREAQAKEQEKLDEDSEPVSEEQRREWEYEKALEKGDAPRGLPPGPARQPSSTARVAPTRGGAQPNPGPATPKVEAEDVRPRKPNEDQYPKG